MYALREYSFTENMRSPLKSAKLLHTAVLHNWLRSSQLFPGILVSSSLVFWSAHPWCSGQFIPGVPVSSSLVFLQPQL